MIKCYSVQVKNIMIVKRDCPVGRSLFYWSLDVYLSMLVDRCYFLFDSYIFFHVFYHFILGASFDGVWLRASKMACRTVAIEN